MVATIMAEVLCVKMMRGVESQPLIPVGNWILIFYLAPGPGYGLGSNLYKIMQIFDSNGFKIQK